MSRRVVALVVVAVLLVVLGIGHRIALRDLRRLEADYVAAREPTACATQSLLPFAFGKIDFEALDAELERLVTEAGEESHQLREGFDDRQVLPIGPVADARRALTAALDAQTDLYDAMLRDPAGSDDELRRLGRRNTAVERRFERARNVLLVGRPNGWDRRFVCDDPPPATSPAPPAEE